MWYILFFKFNNPSKTLKNLHIKHTGKLWLFAFVLNSRTDAPKYCISEHGKVTRESADLLGHPWDDMVSFYIGCSFSFEEALVNAGICEDFIKQDSNVPMYKTNIECHSVGPFACAMVVSMRPVPKALVEKAVQVTSAYDAVHGTPIHIGDPEAIGINLGKPDFGRDSFELTEGEVPLFWACGVTSSLAVRSAGQLEPFQFLLHCTRFCSIIFSHSNLFLQSCSSLVGWAIVQA